tara:strand:+ start:797 stop:901 length:105 start_codon:yes stop_codon:yes gene_type:complete
MNKEKLLKWLEGSPFPYEIISELDEVIYIGIDFK